MSHLIDRERALRLGIDLGGECFESSERRVDIETLVLVRAKDLREHVGGQPPRHEVGISDGQRTALPVAGGARVRRRTLRSHDEQTIAEKESRGAA